LDVTNRIRLSRLSDPDQFGWPFRRSIVVGPSFTSIEPNLAQDLACHGFELFRCWGSGFLILGNRLDHFKDRRLAASVLSDQHIDSGRQKGFAIEREMGIKRNDQFGDAVVRRHKAWLCRA